MQLKVEHQHKQLIQQQQVTPTPTKKQLKQLPLTASRQIKQPLPPPSFPNLTSSTSFSSPALVSLLDGSRSELTDAVATAIQESLHFHQSRIYRAVLEENKEFIAAHLVGSMGVKEALHNMMDQIHGEIEAGVWDGRYQIKNKSHFSLEDKRDKLVVQIAEDLLKKNLSSLKQDIQTLDPISPDAYRSDHPSTKAAEQFVKKMREEKEIKMRMKLQLQEQKREREQKRQQEEKAYEQHLKEEKRLQILKRMKQNEEITKQQRQKRQKIHKDYLQLVANYKKPLYKDREEKYRKQLVSQHKQKLQFLQEWHDDHRSITYEQILQHMDRYKEIKEQKEYARDEAIELKEKQMMLRKKGQKYYKGKMYRQIEMEALDEEMQQFDPKEMSMEKMKRQIQYAQIVKKSFMPKKDEKKYKQMQQMLNKTRAKTIDLPPNKHIQEGKRNLQKMHQMINDLRAKGKLKQSLDLSAQRTLPKPYPNYLHELRSSSAINRSYISSSFIAPQNLQEMKILAKMREERAKNKELYLESSIGTMKIEDHMQGRKEVENQYLQSIKVKAQMLKQLQK